MLINLLFQASNLVMWAIQIYMILVIIYVLMSWIPASRETKFGQVLSMVVEPYLSFFRKIIPPIGMIDISPIIALIALRFIAEGLGYLFTMIISALL